MSCKSCNERKEIIKREIKEKGLTGVITSTTKVGRHIIQNLPFVKKVNASS